jgi:hypothetical protein
VYLRDGGVWGLLLPVAVATASLLCAYFATGLVLTDAPIRALGGILLIPVFLPWRFSIELLGAMGYGRSRWVRTSRVRVHGRGSPLKLEKALEKAP